MTIPNFLDDERADNVYLKEPGTDFTKPPEEGTTNVFSPNREQSKPPITTTPPEPFKFKTQDAYTELMNLKAPVIEKDEGREKRLTAMAGATGVGKALSVLGDMYALSKGAIIPKRDIATKDPHVAQILQDQEKLRDKMDQRDFQEYLNKLRMGENLIGKQRSEYEFEVGQDRFAQQMGLSRDKYESDKTYRADQLLAKKAYDQWRIQNDMEDNDLARKKYVETGRHNRMMELASIIRANKTGESKAKKYGLYNSQGQKIADIEDGQIDMMFNIVKKNVIKRDIEDDMEAMLLQFGEGETMNKKKTIIVKYWEEIPQIKEFLMGPPAPVKDKVRIPGIDISTRDSVVLQEGVPDPRTKSGQEPENETPSFFQK